MRCAQSVMVWALLALMLAGPGTFAQEKEGQPERNEPYATIPYVTPPAWKSVEIGDFYLRRKEYRAALSRYQEAVTTDPYYPHGYLGLGKACEKLGLKQKALTAYQKYLDLLPSEKDAQEAKAVHRSIEKLQRGLKKSASRSPALDVKHPPQ